VEVNDRKWPEEGQLRQLWNEHRGGILAAVGLHTLSSVDPELQSASLVSPLEPE
jgi:hypothetical protein